MIMAPALMWAVGKTLFLFAAASLLSISMATIWSLIRTNIWHVPPLNWLILGVTTILRGIPLYALLLIVYFVLPDLTGINLSADMTGIICLGMCSAAYSCEILRAGIISIPKGQWQAAQVLGYSSYQMVRYIIAPQVLRASLPSLTNEYVQVLKSTAILGAIGSCELTKVGTNMMTKSAQPITVCISIALLYLALTSIISGIGYYLERKYNAYSY